MYSCFECGALYKKDGKTKVEWPKDGCFTFAMIWTCPKCEGKK